MLQTQSARKRSPPSAWQARRYLLRDCLAALQRRTPQRAPQPGTASAQGIRPCHALPRGAPNFRPQQIPPAAPVLLNTRHSELAATLHVSVITRHQTPPMCHAPPSLSGQAQCSVWQQLTTQPRARRSRSRTSVLPSGAPVLLAKWCGPSTCREQDQASALIYSHAVRGSSQCAHSTAMAPASICC